jgi:MFS family permease
MIVKAAPTGYPPPHYAWYVTGVLIFVNMLAYIDRLAVNMLVIPIQNDLGVTDTQMGLVIGPAFVVLYALAGIPLGYLVDRHSRRNILIMGVVFWSVATIACGLAQTYNQLFLARACVGIGEACLVPAVFSIVADYFPPHQRGRAVGVVTMGIALGSGIATLGGGLILAWAESIGHITLPVVGDIIPWQIVLVAIGTPGLIVAVVLLSVREPARQESLPLAGNAARAVMDASIFTYFRQHWRIFVPVFAAYVLLIYVQYAASGWTIVLLSRNHGMTQSAGAIYYGILLVVVSPLSSLAGGYLADWFIKHRSDGRFLASALVAPIFIPGFLIFALAPNLALTAVGIVLLLFPGAFVGGTVYTAIQEIAPNRLRGRMLAVYGLVAYFIGLGFGPSAVGFITDHVFGDPAQIHLSLLVATLPAVVVSMLCFYIAMPGYRATREALMAA